MVEGSSAMRSVVRVWIPVHLVLLALACGLIFRASALDLAVLAGLWMFFPIGLIGALLGNVTGIGGGSVFVPVLAALQGGSIMFPPDLVQLATQKAEEAVAVSFAIQCFGLSAGALAWAHAMFVRDSLPPQETVPTQTLAALTFAPLATGIPALLLVQAYMVVEGSQLLEWFRVFALALGAVLLVFALAQRGQAGGDHKVWVSPGEIWALLGIGAVGGVVTALFSVGIGAFLVLYLVWRRFPAKAAIAVAVWVSLGCMIAGVWNGFLYDLVRPEIVLIAVPGAVIGGIAAKWVASALATMWVMVLASIWIIAAGVYLFVV